MFTQKSSLIFTPTTQGYNCTNVQESGMHVYGSNDTYVSNRGLVLLHRLLVSELVNKFSAN